MIFEDVEDNLVDVVMRLGELRIDQLVEFFRPAKRPKEMLYFINMLSRYSLFEIDETNRKVSFKNSAAMSDDFKRRVQIAFWILADFGCDNVREYDLADYPTMLWFYTEDGAIYDVSVINNVEDAIIAKRRREHGLTKPNSDDSLEDLVNHIAIVPWESVGEEIENYGFDSYCILDKTTNKPQYYTWN